MPENLVDLNLLMAGSAASAAAIEQALRDYRPRVVVHRIDREQDLRRALDIPGWHMVFSDLELADCSAYDLLDMLDEKGLDIPVIVIEGTGDEEIAMRCLQTDMCRSIRCTAAFLKRLPRLVDDLLRRSERERVRCQSERALIESEERFLDVFDHTSDLIQCLAPDGSFVYTNRAWRETLGYSEQEARSLKLADVLHPDSFNCCQDRFRRLLGGDTLNSIDFKFVTRSGDPVHLVGDCGSIIKEGGVKSTRGIFRNVSDTVRARKALKESEARYQALYDNAPDVYTTISASGEILSINHNGASLLGYEVDELIGESAAKLIHPEDQRVVFECVETLFRNPGTWANIEYRKTRKDGSIFWVHQRAGMEPGATAERLLVVCRDITDKRNLEDKLAYQASHDGLTNLINRREFEQRFQQILERGTGPTDSHVLCFLDLDQFKLVNDSCGHVAGDELLRQIATLLAGLVRSRDTLARIGGDEFAVLMEHASLDKALQRAEKIRQAIEGFEFHWRSQRFTIGVSIGVVAVQTGRSLTDALNLADMACYTAKKAGRNRVHAVQS